MVLDMFSNRSGDYDLGNMGSIDVIDAMTSVIFFSAVSTLFLAAAGITIPTGDTTSIALGSEWFAFSGYSVSYALASALGLFGYELAKSAQYAGRSNDMDVQEYVNDLPTGLTVAIAITLLAHIALLFDFTNISNVFTSSFMRQLGTVAISTGSYMALSREN